MLTDTYLFVFFVYDALLLSWGIVSNFIVLVTYGRRSVTKSPTVLLVLSLSLSDLTACLVATPLDVSTLLHSITFNSSSNASHFSTNLLCQSSLGVWSFSKYLTLFIHALSTVNQYCAVKRTLSSRLTKRAILLLATVSVFVSFIIGVVTGSLSAFIPDSITGPCNIQHRKDILVHFQVVLSMSIFLLIIVLNIITVTKVRKQQRSVSITQSKPCIQIQNMPHAEISSNSDIHIESPTLTEHMGSYSLRTSVCTSQSTECHPDSVNYPNTHKKTCIPSISYPAAMVSPHRTQRHSIQGPLQNVNFRDLSSPSPLLLSPVMSPYRTLTPSTLLRSSYDRSTSPAPNKIHSIRAASTSDIKSLAAPSRNLPFISQPANEDAAFLPLSSLSLSVTNLRAGATSALSTFFPLQRHEKLPKRFQQVTLQRMTRALFIRTVVFALIWMPGIITACIQHDTMVNLHQHEPFLFALVVFLNEFPKLNHIINPVVYSFASSKFKHEFKKLIKRTNEHS